MTRLIKLIKVLPLVFFLSTSAYAQKKNDNNTAIQIEADQLVYDDNRQTTTLTGNVQLTRGTLILKGHKMVVSQDRDGYQYATLYAASGKLATFRQKRNSENNLWIEGKAADRIEFNGKTEVLQLFGKASVMLLNGTNVTDQVEGEFISYDSRSEFYTVQNSPEGAAKPDGGRVRVIIQPRNENKGK